MNSPIVNYTYILNFMVCNVITSYSIHYTKLYDAEEFLKYLIKYALDHCADDLRFLSDRLIEEERNKPQSERSMELIEKLKFVLDNDFARITRNNFV